MGHMLQPNIKILKYWTDSRRTQKTAAKFFDARRHRWDKPKPDKSARWKKRGGCCRRKGINIRTWFSWKFIDATRGGRSDAKAALFSTLGNILESWRKPSFQLSCLRLLSSRIFNFHCRRPYLLPDASRTPTTSHFSLTPLSSHPISTPSVLHAQNGDVAISLLARALLPRVIFARLRFECPCMLLFERSCGNNEQFGRYLRYFFQISIRWNARVFE